MAESDVSQKPWFDNPNAPRIPQSLYVAEKTTFTGYLICAILYGMQSQKLCLPEFTLYVPSVILGIIIVLFFQCMAALLDPTNRTRGGFRPWGLVVYIVAMFSFVTIYTAVTLDLLSNAYIDNREFRGGNGLAPGPVGYRFSAYSKPVGTVPQVMFLFNNWLADGLLVSFSP
jgi:hypothetical protein